MTDIQQALQWGKAQLQGTESPQVDVPVLLGHCLQQSYSYLLTWPEKKLTDQQWQHYQGLIHQRQAGHPVAYLIGYRDFWTLRLDVSPATLIPRPETELLVERVLSHALVKNARVLDLGTGTGAIALALASERPAWSVTGVDVNPAAVALATANGQKNHLPQVRFLCSDWFEQFNDERFDVIVANPPYVEQGSGLLQQGDVRFEPDRALISGIDGLDDIRHIVASAPKFLQPNGWLLMEHGYNQRKEIHNILELNNFSSIHCYQDLADLDRVTEACYI